MTTHDGSVEEILDRIQNALAEREKNTVEPAPMPAQKSVAVPAAAGAKKSTPHHRAPHISLSSSSPAPAVPQNVKELKKELSDFPPSDVKKDDDVFILTPEMIVAKPLGEKAKYDDIADILAKEMSQYLHARYLLPKIKTWFFENLEEMEKMLKEKNG